MLSDFRMAILQLKAACKIHWVGGVETLARSLSAIHNGWNVRQTGRSRPATTSRQTCGCKRRVTPSKTKTKKKAYSIFIRSFIPSNRYHLGLTTIFSCQIHLYFPLKPAPCQYATAKIGKFRIPQYSEKRKKLRQKETVEEEIQKVERKIKSQEQVFEPPPQSSTQPLTPCSLGDPITPSPWRSLGRGLEDAG
jgi:hypothetical protein